jgi:hypothetical protein
MSFSTSSRTPFTVRNVHSNPLVKSGFLHGGTRARACARVAERSNEQEYLLLGSRSPAADRSRSGVCCRAASRSAPSPAPPYGVLGDKVRERVALSSDWQRYAFRTRALGTHVSIAAMPAKRSRSKFSRPSKSFWRLGFCRLVGMFSLTTLRTATARSQSTYPLWVPAFGASHSARNLRRRPVC